MDDQRRPDSLCSSPAAVRNFVDIPLGPDGTLARFYSFDNLGEAGEHLLIAFQPLGANIPLVRVHSECLTGDVFGSQRCDCGPQLAAAIEHLSHEGGYLIYLRQEGRGIGIYAKLAAYGLQDQGLDTFEANLHLGFREDMRDYRSAALMLRAVSVREIRLITNNPDKVRQLESYGITVAERLSAGSFPTVHNIDYLAAKVLRANHEIALDDVPI
jgi:GTP cyclohydrolase II